MQSTLTTRHIPNGYRVCNRPLKPAAPTGATGQTRSDQANHQR